MAFGEGLKDRVAVIDKGPPVDRARLMRRGFAFGQQKHGQGLVLLTEKVNDFSAWPRPGNPPDLYIAAKLGRGSKDAFHHGARRAEIGFPRQVRVFAGNEQVKRVGHRDQSSKMIFGGALVCRLSRFSATLRAIS